MEAAAIPIRAGKAKAGIKFHTPEVGEWCWSAGRDAQLLFSVEHAGLRTPGARSGGRLFNLLGRHQLGYLPTPIISGSRPNACLREGFQRPHDPVRPDRNLHGTSWAGTSDVVDVPRRQCASGESSAWDVLAVPRGSVPRCSCPQPWESPSAPRGAQPRGGDREPGLERLSKSSYAVELWGCEHVVEEGGDLFLVVGVQFMARERFEVGDLRVAEDPGFS